MQRRLRYFLSISLPSKSRRRLVPVAIRPDDDPDAAGVPCAVRDARRAGELHRVRCVLRVRDAARVPVVLPFLLGVVLRGTNGLVADRRHRRRHRGVRLCGENVWEAVCRQCLHRRHAQWNVVPAQRPLPQALRQLWAFCRGLLPCAWAFLRLRRRCRQPIRGEWPVDRGFYKSDLAW